MSGDHDILDHLADLSGIESSYLDIWGERRVLSRASKRMFLAAMGLAADTEVACAESIGAIERAVWLRLLDPVTIHIAGEETPLTVAVKHVAVAAGGVLSWTLIEENGARHEGRIRAIDLPLEKRHVVDGRTCERRALALPVDLALGYHRLEARLEYSGGTETGTSTVIAAPRQCYLPDELAKAPGVWGFSLQLYGLAGPRSWGIGDFGELARFAGGARELGASVIGLNPINAPFIGDPAHASPYAPSHRGFLNPLYIEIEAVPEFSASQSAQAEMASPAFQSRLASARASPKVDYGAVSALKLSVLEHLYATFRASAGRERAADFARFRKAGGATLAAFATFEALSEHFRRGRIGPFSWRDWPAPYRDPASPEVAKFAAVHDDRLGFYEYLQWQAECQLTAAADRADGSALGLYRDLSLGADPHGAESWMQQQHLSFGATLGAPPDPFNLKGQNWGLPPFNPISLRECAYAPFIELLRSNMRHAGALRIDHILGFSRLFWIPEGASAAEGGYVRAPFDHLIAITALESQRARCVVVGEDLGTVPAGLRERLTESTILSCRLLYFERGDNDSFRRPESYPTLAQVAVGSHDLPTFPGYWRGRDLDVFAALGLFPSKETERVARTERVAARHELIRALIGEGLWPEDRVIPETATDELIAAVYCFLARSRGRLLIVQLDDVVGQTEQTNLPGTTSGHDNWCRKLPLAGGNLVDDPRVTSLARLLRAIRPGDEANPP